MTVAHLIRRGRRWPLPAIAVVAAAACSSHHEDATGLTVEEQRQLNEAAAILDANGVDPPAADAHERSPHD